MSDLNKFIDWANQGKNRKVKIELESNKKPFIYVWDFDVAGFNCQPVSSINEIDLEATAAKERRAQYERLKAEFESEPKLNQPTADDEAAQDFQRLQQARTNTPEANMEQPEQKIA